MTNQKQVRMAFWERYPQYAPLCRQSKRQNDYPADVRMQFCDMVDDMERSGEITEALAQRVTL